MLPWLLQVSKNTPSPLPGDDSHASGVEFAQSPVTRPKRTSFNAIFWKLSTRPPGQVTESMTNLHILRDSLAFNYLRENNRQYIILTLFELYKTFQLRNCRWGTIEK